MALNHLTLSLQFARSDDTAAHRAVLPRQPKLEQAILSPKKLRRCEVCGTGILARSGRTKYCPACAKEVHRQQKAESARKRRSGVDNLGAKSP